MLVPKVEVQLFHIVLQHRQQVVLFEQKPLLVQYSFQVFNAGAIEQEVEVLGCLSLREVLVRCLLHLLLELIDRKV